MPLLIVLNDSVATIVPGPIANTAKQGAVVLRCAGAPARGQAILYEHPCAPGTHAWGRVARAPAEMGRLQSGQLWVSVEGAEAEPGSEHGVDSQSFGPLPLPLVVGTPIAFFPSLG